MDGEDELHWKSVVTIATAGIAIAVAVAIAIAILILILILILVDFYPKSDTPFVNTKHERFQQMR